MMEAELFIDPEDIVNRSLSAGFHTVNLTLSIISGLFDDNSSTNSSNFTEYVYDYDPNNYIPLEDVLPVTLTYSLTLLLGLVGNILVIFSILYYRRMRTTTNVFLLSLASADLLLVVLCIPIKAARFLTFAWEFGEPLCKLVNYTQHVSMICSILTLTSISLERVVAVAWPLRARYICTMRHAYMVVLIVWAMSFIFAVPNALITEHIEVGDRFKAYWCRKEFSSRFSHIAYEMYMLTLVFILPISIMLSTYGVICFKVWKFSDMRTDMRSGRIIAPAPGSRESKNVHSGSKRDKTESNTLLNDSAASCNRRPPPKSKLVRAIFKKKNSTTEDAKATRQLIVMLVMVVVLFILCWGPIMMNNVLVAFGVLHELNYGYLKPMRMVFSLLSYMNSCVNPIVYAFLSKNFRQSFRYALLGCLKGHGFVRAYTASRSIVSSVTSGFTAWGRRAGSAIVRKGSSGDYTQTVTQALDEPLEMKSVVTRADKVPAV